MTTKKTIFLIRHGETEYNKKGIIQGSGINSNLNSKGIEQAQLFHMAYKHIPFDKIYTSQLVRTIQSVDSFIKKGIKHEILNELNEINWGIMEGILPSPLHQRIYDQMIEGWKNGHLDMSVENAETPNELAKRQKKGLKKIMSKHDENTILICMHGRAMRTFLCLLLNIPLSKMEDFKHSNLCLYVLEFENNIFSIKTENSISHLYL